MPYRTPARPPLRTLYPRAPWWPIARGPWSRWGRFARAFIAATLLAHIVLTLVFKRPAVGGVGLLAFRLVAPAALMGAIGAWRRARVWWRLRARRIRRTRLPAQLVQLLESADAAGLSVRLHRAPKCEYVGCNCPYPREAGE